MDRIDKFQGEYRFLSNFYPCTIEYDGIKYLSVEAYYQAQKTKTIREKMRFAEMQAAMAKAEGRRVFLPVDWEDRKEQIMEKGLRIKFKDIFLRRKLLNTGNVELIEGNTWGDQYWGVRRGIGKNRLGILLMKIRDEIR